MRMSASLSIGGAALTPKLLMSSSPTPCWFTFVIVDANPKWQWSRPINSLGQILAWGCTGIWPTCLKSWSKSSLLKLCKKLQPRHSIQIAKFVLFLHTGVTDEQMHFKRWLLRCTSSKPLNIQLLLTSTLHQIPNKTTVNHRDGWNLVQECELVDFLSFGFRIGWSTEYGTEVSYCWNCNLRLLAPLLVMPAGCWADAVLT